jgi:hypothetical protein
MDSHIFKINGIKWPWKYVRLRGKAAGWTFMPDAKNPDVTRKILIDSRLTGRARLDVEIHEYLHAALGVAASEEHVTQTATDLARILHSLGYRLVEKPA